MANTYENYTVNDLTDTDAKFQAWVQAIEAAFLASGFLVVAADTGQINPATVTKPTVVSTYAGFRIYKANDSLQATKPLYVKMEYGVSIGVNRPICRVTIATATNGAGTLTGVISSASTLQGTGSDGSGAAFVIGGGGSRCAFFQHYDSGNTNFQNFFAIGRFLNPADGGAGGDGYTAFFMQANAQSQTIGASLSYGDGAAAWSSSQIGVLVTDPSGSIHGGGDVNTVMLFQAMLYRNAGIWVMPLLVGKATELPWSGTAAASKFSMLIWGQAHTFVPIQHGAVSGANDRLAMLWE